MPVFILLETHAAIWAHCNSQWAVTDHADDDDVAAMVSAAGQLERAKPATIAEWMLKWRALAAYWCEFEMPIDGDDIEKMLAEFAEATRC
jgi:hypothetical protein